MRTKTWNALQQVATNIDVLYSLIYHRRCHAVRGENSADFVG
jgi:hypothetical protein